MKSEELIEKLRAAQIDSEITGQPMRLDVKIQDLLDAFAEKDAQLAFDTTLTSNAHHFVTVRLTSKFKFEDNPRSLQLDF